MDNEPHQQPAYSNGAAAAAKAAEALNDAGTPTQKPSGENDEQPIDE